MHCVKRENHKICSYHLTECNRILVCAVKLLYNSVQSLSYYKTDTKISVLPSHHGDESWHGYCNGMNEEIMVLSYL